MNRLNFKNADAREIARLKKLKGPCEILEALDDGADDLEGMAVVKLARRNGADDSFNVDDLNPRDFL